MNKVILLGRMARDAEVRQTNTGKSVAQFTVAVDKYVKNGEHSAVFIPCVAWDKTADFVNQWFKKGSMILVEGRIDVRSYDDKDGVKRWVTEIIVERIEFAGSKSDATNANAGPAQPRNERPARQSQVDAWGGSVTRAREEEIPF